MAVQLVKLLDAGRVPTSVTGLGLNMVAALGADNVVDYDKKDSYDALANDRVDVACDNIGFLDSADKALRVLRSGSTYILLPGERQPFSAKQTSAV